MRQGIFEVQSQPVLSLTPRLSWVCSLAKQFKTREAGILLALGGVTAYAAFQAYNLLVQVPAHAR